MQITWNGEGVFFVMSENHREKLIEKNVGVALKHKPTKMDGHETSLVLFRPSNHSPTRGTWSLVDPTARCD